LNESSSESLGINCRSAEILDITTQPGGVSTYSAFSDICSRPSTIGSSRRSSLH
jgi:hypothetical protein